MKAVIWRDINKVEYTDVPEPKCAPGWAKLRVIATGLCATEAHMISGAFDGGKPPHILGHEICGDIVELGEGCDTVLLGKRAVVETYVGCGKCFFCRTGRKHLCTAGEIGYPPYPGGHAQFVTVPQGCIHMIPDSISYDEGGILEAVACPFGALQSSGFRLGQTILVLGAGVGGLSFLQAARAAGAEKILCAARSDEKLRQAKYFGADAVIDLRKEKLLDRVLEETGGLGADMAVDAAGAPQTIAMAVGAVRRGGSVLLYGIPDRNAEIPFPVTDIILRQITVCGYTGNEFGWDPLISLVAKGRVNVRDMVSYRFPLGEYERALSLLRNKPADLIKIVLHPWD